jgi:cytochrome b6-f complex iron-sulfur subunit
MKRDQFLSSFGIGVAAICAGGCLAACGGKGGSSGGTAITPPVPPSNVNFTIDLNNEIKSVGESKISNSIIVVRIAAGNTATSFTAVQAACSHEGTIIGYSANLAQFVCPNHGSTFGTAGNVTLGPATTALKKYTIAVTGTTMTVTG